jgi:hypothetical protein
LPSAHTSILEAVDRRNTAKRKVNRPSIFQAP